MAGKSTIGGVRPKTGGRKEGTPNKATTMAREAIAAFADANSTRMQGWLDDVAADEKHGPAVAFKMLMEVMEYHLPKLARTEHTGANGGPIVVAATNIDERL